MPDGHFGLQPTLDTERHVILDVLRGFALYGVLLANLVWLTTDMVLTDARLRELPTANVDPIARALVAFFVDGKFYTLFAFLFGLGFSIGMDRAQAGGAHAEALHVRRLCVLIAIGILHIALFWYGDILLMYGLLGFGLFLFRRTRPRPWLVVLALVLALSARMTFVASRAAVSPPSVTSAGASSDQASRTREERLAALGSSYRRVVRANVAIYWGDLVLGGFALFGFPQVFARFLLGLYAGKRRIAERVPDYLPLMRRALPWLVGVALIGNGIGLIHRWFEHERGMALSASWWLVGTIPLHEAGIVALSAVYACGVCLLFFDSARWQTRLARLAPVGRMALTNYLTHSVLYLCLFTGAGLGLLGTIGPTICVALSMVIYLVQVLVSDWWLRRFRYGPAEWAWRTLTYGHIQPLSK